MDDDFSAANHDDESYDTANEQEETVSQDASQEKSISADLIRGHINTIILRALYEGDKYGYEIIAEIEKKSRGQYSLKQPSLYSALKRLEKDGYITSYWGGSVAGGRRKYFSLTDAGKEIAERNRSEWEYSRTVIDSLISDRAFDFDNSPIPTAVNMRVLKESTSRTPAQHGETEEEYYYSEDLAPTAEELKQLERERIAFEEERAKKEEELRLREEERIRKEEDFRLREEERIRKEEDFRLREEERIRKEEEFLKKEEEHIRREEELRLREETLNSVEEALKTREESFKEVQPPRDSETEELLEEQRRQAERIAQMESELEEHRSYEQQLLFQESEARERHRQELAEQERRIRAEEESYYRQREQEVIHQNYLNLINSTPAPVEKSSEPSYFTSPLIDDEEDYPAEPERDYRSVIHRIYSGTVAENRPRNTDEDSEEVVRLSGAAEQNKNKQSGAKRLGGIDFYDLETQAKKDGIRITTAGGAVKTAEAPSEQLYNKGKALFYSALAVFMLLLAVGSLSLGLQALLALPRFFPYFIWGTGLAFLLIAGLAYLNHYGERSLRRQNNLLVTTVVTFALCVIVVLIISLALQIDFSDIRTLSAYVIFPILYCCAVIIFGFVYYSQVRPEKEN